MATTIVTKSGSGAPTASDLVAGELAVDLTNKRLYTEDSGGTVLELGTNPASDVTFGDNTKAIFGAGSDLQIYHDGNHSRIVESGGGDMIIQGDEFSLMNVAGTEYMIFADNDSFVKLYYDGSAKLATTATGIDVTGSVTADGLTVDGDAYISDALPRLILNETDATDLNTAFRNNAGVLKIQTVNDAANSFTSRVDIDHSSGVVSFYEDTGTTPKMVWDASAESLGIGGSPDTTLTVFGSGVAEFRVGNIGPSSNSAIRVSRNDTTVTSGNPLGYLEFGGNDSTSNLDTAFAYVGAEASGAHTAGDNPTDLVFGTTADNTAAPTERMRVTATGIDVTGSVTADGLVVDGGGSLTFSELTSKIIGPLNQDFIIQQRGNAATEALRIQNVDNNNLAKFDKNGDISFYNTAGTSQSLFWDASAESLGIGTTSAASVLDVRGARSDLLRLYSTAAGGNAEIELLTLNNASSVGKLSKITATQVGADTNGSILAFSTSPTTGNTPVERLRIDSSGKVGIGTSSPSGAYAQPSLHIHATGNGAELHLTDTTTGATSSDGMSIFQYANDGYIHMRENGNLRMYVNGDERMRLDASGHAIIPAGVTLGTAAGVYAAANTLDDYEEGTWTPDLINGTGITYTTTPTGSYTKIGKIVHISASIDVSNSDTADASGLTISGLPFSAVGDAMTFTLGRYRSFLAPKDSVVLGAVAGGSVIQLFESNNNFILYSEIGSSGILTFSGTYEEA